MNLRKLQACLFTFLEKYAIILYGKCRPKSKYAPCPNPCRRLIVGKVCGVAVENIEEPLMQEIRYLDKLVDELAKGRPMERILRSN